MKFLRTVISIVVILSGLYGLYNQVFPTTFPWRTLPSGMGLSLFLIASTMGYVLLIVERERQERASERDAGELWTRVTGRLCACAPAHEREFYSLWTSQVTMAQNNVDVTHLGIRPPQNSYGKEEEKYFSELKTLYRNSRAQVRRVERFTADKLPWIEKLVVDFRGARNFSLHIYKDPFESEMPAALSVCRVDDRFAWIIAIAEHESTGTYRDLLITGKDGTELIRQYFQERLWKKSTAVIEHGDENPNWRHELGL